jgi:hypothetical protein
MRDAAGSAPLAENRLIRRLIVIVTDLDLDRDDFVIFGSAPLLAHGLRRRIHDVDVVARGDTWRRVRERGAPARGDINGAPMASFWGGRIQFSSGWISDVWPTDTIIDNAETIEGLPYARLTDVLAYKQTLCRAKDGPDIDAIIEFLRRPGRDIEPAPRLGMTGPVGPSLAAHPRQAVSECENADHGIA